ncbi:MAG: hypothetical protein JWN76_1315 [Chitinophagaceae bacterium]|nr:hypothetical protein [Chitinophagaceae bacterium]
MQLSVIIVSYNVKHFLEYCLYSLREATKGIEHEVIIIDNASSDDTTISPETKFSEIIWLKNKTNKGFGAACNQGISIAGGEYILLLNPDTLVTPEAIVKTLSFIQEGNKGIAGIRMIDGDGKFLTEMHYNSSGLYLRVSQIILALFQKVSFKHKKNSEVENEIDFYFMGDPSSINQAQKIIRRKFHYRVLCSLGKQLSPSLKKGTIIFCVSENFDFSECIRLFVNKTAGVKCKWYTAGLHQL